MSLSSSAQFDYNENCSRAHLAILDLQTRTAREILQQEKALHPGNGLVIYLEQYADVVELIVTDDEARYDRLVEVSPGRFDSLDKLDDDTPFKELIQAEMLFYLGLAQVKFGNQLGGASKIYSSYRTVKAQREDHPEFSMNLKMAGMYNIMMDFIPQSVRWLTGILGVEGDSEEGMVQLMEYFQYVKATPGLAQEAVIIINLAHKLTWKDEEGLQFLDRQEPWLTDNNLARYLWAISATFSFENDLALERLGQIDKKELQVPFYFLDYIQARCLLNSLDTRAIEGFKSFLEKYPGQDFRKDVCNRLSYAYFLKGDMVGYNKYKSLALTTGNEMRDRDIEAMKESSSPIVPHQGLLKARLLFDGGYFDSADSLMQTIPERSLNTMPFRLEYHYRQGRIDQQLGQVEKAISSLESAAVQGAEQPYTFATRAALQLGIIYEDQSNFPNALFWYDKCLEYYDDDHTAGSVQDKAKKGKKRMESLLK